MTDLPIGRADLHIHSLASDGVSSVAEILEHAQRVGLNVIAITDHERVDAAHAARAMAEARGLDIEVIVGEEITTRGGHLVALFIDKRIKPWGSLKSSIARVHEQGGLAIVAHPLVPYPLCASGKSIRKLLDEADATFHPDAIEALNPTTGATRWGARVPAFVTEVGVAAVGSSDAHRAEDVGHVVTTFARPDALPICATRSSSARPIGRALPIPWATSSRRSGASWARTRPRCATSVRGTILRDGTGRDLGYPGGRRRPARLDESELGLP